MHTCAYTSTQMNTYTQMTHTYTHTHTYAHAHAHTHTHARTHTATPHSTLESEFSDSATGTKKTHFNIKYSARGKTATPHTQDATRLQQCAPLPHSQRTRCGTNQWFDCLRTLCSNSADWRTCRTLSNDGRGAHNAWQKFFDTIHYTRNRLTTILLVTVYNEPLPAIKEGRGLRSSYSGTKKGKNCIVLKLCVGASLDSVYFCLPCSLRLF